MEQIFVLEVEDQRGERRSARAEVAAVARDDEHRLLALRFICEEHTRTWIEDLYRSSLDCDRPQEASQSLLAAEPLMSATGAPGARPSSPTRFPARGQRRPSCSAPICRRPAG